MHDKLYYFYPVKKNLLKFLEFRCFKLQWGRFKKTTYPQRQLKKQNWTWKPFFAGTIKSTKKRADSSPYLKVPSEREPGRYVSYNVSVWNKNHLLADDKVRTFRVFCFDKLNSLTNVATIYKNKNHERPRDLISAIRLQVWKKSLDLHDYSTPQSLTRAYPGALAVRN